MTNTSSRGGWRRARLVMAAPLLLALTMGADECGGGTGPIPSPENDHPPVITFGNIFLGGSGTLDPPDVSSELGRNVTVNVVEASACVPHLWITTNASNPGGVMELEVTITRDDRQEPLYEVGISATADNETGQVPRQLNILGTDGQGGQGPTPLEIFYDGELEGMCERNVTFTVTAVATNFNGQTTEFREAIQGLNNRCCP